MPATPRARELATQLTQELERRQQTVETDALLEELQRLDAIRLEPDTRGFARHLAQHLSQSEDVPRALRELHHLDFCVAFAAASGDASAQRRVESEYLQPALGALRRRHESESAIEEVAQHLRRALFAPAEGPARLLQYSGRGSLRSWLRVALLRTALNLRAAQSREPEPVEDVSELELPLVNERPELTLLRNRFAAAFNEAFREALTALSERQKAVLRAHVLGGLSVAAIATMYQVDRSTAQRWVAGTRQQLLDQTRATLAARFALQGSELDSVIRACRSLLDVSLSEYLGSTA